jgi:hypothetical protein
MRSVTAMANTPSLNASRREVSTGEPYRGRRANDSARDRGPT